MPSEYVPFPALPAPAAMLKDPIGGAAKLLFWALVPFLVLVPLLAMGLVLVISAPVALLRSLVVPARAPVRNGTTAARQLAVQ